MGDAECVPLLAPPPLCLGHRTRRCGASRVGKRACNERGLGPQHARPTRANHARATALLPAHAGSVGGVCSAAGRVKLDRGSDHPRTASPLTHRGAEAPRAMQGEGPRKVNPELQAAADRARARGNAAWAAGEYKAAAVGYSVALDDIAVLDGDVEGLHLLFANRSVVGCAGACGWGGCGCGVHGSAAGAPTHVPLTSSALCPPHAQGCGTAKAGGVPRGSGGWAGSREPRTRVSARVRVRAAAALDLPAHPPTHTPACPPTPPRVQLGQGSVPPSAGTAWG